MKKRGMGLRKDNKGMTLIEVLCSIAIFSCLIAAISGVLVVVANTYNSGATETTLQQESQFTANLIGTLIVEATDAVNYQYFDDAAGWVDADSETAALASGAGADKDRRLVIVNDGGVEKYEIYYRPAIQEITYKKYHSAGETPEYTVAEDVTSFGADVSDFDASQNVIVEIAMERDSKQYAMSYNMTARNGNLSTTPSVPTDWAIITVDTELVMEPCQELVLPVSVLGTQTAYTSYLTGNSSSATTATEETGAIRIKLGSTETGNGSGFIVLTIHTVANGPDGRPLALKNVFIRVRRVNSMNVNMVKDVATALDYVANTTYTVTAQVAGSNLSKKLNNIYDAGLTPYVEPYYVKWSYEFTVGGAVTNPETYFEFTPQENVTTPTLKFKIKQNLPSNSVLTITALAKHPEGTIDGVAYNKTGSSYDTVMEVVTLDCVVGDDVEELESPFKRGGPYFFDGEILDQSKENYYESVYPGESEDITMNWFWRMREINPDGTYGDWTQYHITKEGGTTKKINEAETECLLPNKAYQIEYICAVYNPVAKKLYWPHDDDLLVVGTGFYEEGYTKTWSVNDTPKAEFKTLYSIGAVEIDFVENASFGVSEGDKSFGTASSPIQFDYSEGKNWGEAKFNPKYLRVHPDGEGTDFSNSFVPVYEMWNGTSWEDITSPTGWRVTRHDAKNFQFQQTDSNATGLYRIGVALKTNLFRTVGGTLLDPTFTSVGEVLYPMYNKSTGEGYIYLQLNP